jgi:hypothetical protein
MVFIELTQYGTIPVSAGPAVPTQPKAGNAEPEGKGKLQTIYNQIFTNYRPASHL